MPQRWYMDPTNPDAAAYRQAHNIKLPGEGSKPPAANQPPAQSNDPKQWVANAANQSPAWNDFAKQLAGQAQNYSQNNPFSQQAQGFQQDILNGDISRNPFMQGLQQDLNGVNMDEAMGYLRDFLGPQGQTNPGGSGGSGGGHVADPNNVTIGGVHLNTAASSGGGQVPDTVGGSNSFFAQHIKDLFDPSRLDPAHDPTMAPYLDMLARKSNEALMGQLADVSARAEGSGIYGTGMYQAMDRNARATSQQALSDSQTQALMAARQQALQDQMNGLGLTNSRDIAAMNDATQRYGIDAQTAASGASNALAAQTAAAQQRLSAIQMMMQGGQFGLSTKSDLANMLQGAQNNAYNNGVNYGQLGMSGFNTGINAGQLGLAGLGQQGQLGLGQQQANLQQRQLNAQNSANRFNQNMALQNMQQGSLNDYLNILLQIGGLGGGSYATNTAPGTPTSQGMDPWLAAILGGLGAAGG